jgi:hypothetical protein
MFLVRRSLLRNQASKEMVKSARQPQNRAKEVPIGQVTQTMETIEIPTQLMYNEGTLERQAKEGGKTASFII